MKTNVFDMADKDVRIACFNEIKQIPDQLHEALRREAKSSGCSLNTLIIRTLSLIEC
jgi:hypothetical protein